MAAFYTSVESVWMKSQRMEREPGIDLVKCLDGLWRTVEEKSHFDRAAEDQFKLLDIPSQITPNQAGS